MKNHQVSMTEDRMSQKDMPNVTDIDWSREALHSLLHIVTDLDRLPKEYNAFLQPLFNKIKKDEGLSAAALEKCKLAFASWDGQEHNGLDELAIKRCMDLWLTIKGEDYPLKKALSNPANLVVQEVEVCDFVDKHDLRRIEFDSATGEPIENSLGNLIIEEVEAADYVNSSETSD
ncbi:hypothetical protein HG536_0G03440 [Torulaspora globosa]|uniref:Nucleolar protein SWM2 n=1 Tax=Torulaspora globosa TaxID=48254 RepID=A0A7G3ZLU6_9SACH|nr:uncharacterized protein HG536_0G03440 [Torulaspora globosa]QLL34482.1 hypothetical protein HG536_0G03440 [Torulaspora globosa]